MNLSRLLLAGIGGFVAYFALGFLLASFPFMRSEFLKYPNVYRPLEGMKTVMPLGIMAMFAAILALGTLYAGLSPAGPGLAAGVRFGALIGVFTVGSFVVHNYVDLNIGLKLTIQQSAVDFLEWLFVGAVIGLIYKPAR